MEDSRNESAFKEEWKKYTFLHTNSRIEEANALLQELSKRGCRKAIDTIKYNEILSMLDNGQEEQGYKLLEELDATGSISARYYLNGAYHKLKEAKQLYDNGALYPAIYKYQDESLKDNGEAMYYLGKIYFEEIQDYATALEYFYKAISYEYVGAYEYIAFIYYFGYLGKEDFEKAEDFFLKAIEYTESVNSYHNLGYIYYERGDYQKAIEYYNVGAKNGFFGSIHNIGSCYYYGTGFKKDYKKAAEYYMLSAKQGFEPSQEMLGKMFITGKVFKKIPFKWFIMGLKSMFNENN